MASPIYNKVDTIFIHVSDLVRSIRWYSNLLGLEVKEEKPKGPIYTLDMGPNRPGLTLDDHSFDTDYKLVTSNQPLFNLCTDDITSAHRYVKEFGVDVSDIQTFPDLSEFTFKDLDGNIIMVCQTT